jgi:hypothetical protein
MTAALEAAPAVASGILLAMAAGLAGLLWWASTGSGESGWQPGELAALVTQTARHRALGATPAELIADDHGHAPRHGWDEVPPSIDVPLDRMTAVERAHELTRQLGNRLYSPWRGLADKRTRVRLSAATIARRHGIPLLLGMAGPVGRLP